MSPEEVVPPGPASAPRDRLVDALKSLAIALVVLGHTLMLPRFEGVADPLFWALSSFHMPLFMGLSGYVLFGHEGESPARFLGKRFLGLMVPYFAWHAIADALACPTWSEWLDRIVVAALDPHSGLWFLYVLFVCDVLFVVIRTVSTRDRWLVVAAVVIAAISVLPGGNLPGLRADLQRLFPFFAGGYLLSKHRPRLGSRIRFLLAVVAAGGFVVALAFEVPNGVPLWYEPLRGYLQSVGFRWSFVILVASRYVLAGLGILAAVAAYSLQTPRILRIEAVLGRSTLGIYAIHGMLLPLAFGAGAAGVVGSWIAITFASWAMTRGLGRVPVVRGLLLGMWRSGSSPSQRPL